MSVYYDPGRYRCQVFHQTVSRANADMPQLVLLVHVRQRYDARGHCKPIAGIYDRTIFMPITTQPMPNLWHAMVDCLCRYKVDSRTGKPCERWSIV